MIRVLTGDNSFEIQRAVDLIVNDFNGEVERVDGSELESRQLPDLLMGATLFADKRLVIIKNLSENKTVWADFVDWLPRLSDDIQLVLVDAKPDKRTKTFKELTKLTKPTEFGVWTERDTAMAEVWAIKEAKQMGWDLDKKSAQTLIARMGVDQWGLYQALQKLAVLGDVTSEIIEEVIDPNPSENVFNLFEAALRGDSTTIGAMIRTLELSEDPYMVCGLLASQAFQLAALAASDGSANEVARDIGAHPFALSKLSSHAGRLGLSGTRSVIAAISQADIGLKSGVGEPWLLVERSLVKIATASS